MIMFVEPIVVPGSRVYLQVVGCVTDDLIMPQIVGILCLLYLWMTLTFKEVIGGHWHLLCSTFMVCMILRRACLSCMLYISRLYVIRQRKTKDDIGMFQNGTFILWMIPYSFYGWSLSFNGYFPLFIYLIFTVHALRACSVYTRHTTYSTYSTSKSFAFAPKMR